MSTIDVKSGLITDSAKVLPDERDSLKPAADENAPKDDLHELAQWVLARVSQWRDHRRSNYEPLWEKYERLWRSMWSGQDKNKKSERSTLVTPALSEAVENIVAEVEEALFGRGDSFDIKAPFGADEDGKKIVDDNKTKLKEDLTTAEFNVNVGEALINAAVYGSGIGEILVETFIKREISASVSAAAADMASGATGMPMDAASSPLSAPPALPMNAAMPSSTPGLPPMAPPAPMQMPQGMPPLPMATKQPPTATVIEREVQFASLQSVNPRNFLIEPTARSVDKALGVAVEEYVGSHVINKGMKDGAYSKVAVGTSAGEMRLGAAYQSENEYVFDKVHVLRYYGLVPRALLFPPGQMADLGAENEGDALGLALRDAESAADAAQGPQGGSEDVYVDLNVLPDGKPASDTTEPIDADMVEAIIVIANQAIAIKAMENPYLMKDRPVVAFPWDVVPGRFWGRGVCEKGFVPQMVMDAELRARIDALAYVSAPMMGMDASRLPRGFQFTVKPGKSILTNGDPNVVLRPLHFGQLDQSTFQHSAQLDQMIQRATGSLDVIALAQKTGDNRSGAMSMMLSGIVKRHKRTLMNFVDRFYIPALRKILWRNMQYNPERYEPRNWDFVAGATMGIIQREYESMTLTQLLNTMEPGSPEFKMILMGIVSNTGLTHRHDLIEMLKQSIQTTQQAAAAQAQMASDPNTMQMQSQLGQAQLSVQIAEAQAKVRELESRANLQDIKARNAQLEPGFRRAELATKALYEVPAEQQDRAIQNRLQMFDRALKAKDIASNERIAATQSQASVTSEAIRARAQIAAARHTAKGKAIGEVAKAAATVAAPKAGASRPTPQIVARSAQLLT